MKTKTVNCLLAAVAFLFVGAVYATECPQGMQSCKVLILSPQEEQLLIQPGGILATAGEARKLDYAGAAQYFIQKIKDAPAGDVKKPDPPPAEPAKP
jgi:hypothetical protein